MKMPRKPFTLTLGVLAVCLATLHAWAAPTASPQPTSAPPSEIASVIHADAPYGIARYTFLFMTAYTAQLWTDAVQWSLQTPFALTLRYNMSFSTDDIVSRSVKEMKHVDPALSSATLKSYGDAMTKVFPAVKSGDEITALSVPGKPVRFFLNGTATGEIDDAGFAADFFGIWLSPQSSDPQMRQGLLKIK